jgi:hypothetical protein
VTWLQSRPRQDVGVSREMQVPRAHGALTAVQTHCDERVCLDETLYDTLGRRFCKKISESLLA